MDLFVKHQQNILNMRDEGEYLWEALSRSLAVYGNILQVARCVAVKLRLAIHLPEEKAKMTSLIIHSGVPPEGTGKTAKRKLLKLAQRRSTGKLRICLDSKTSKRALGINQYPWLRAYFPIYPRQKHSSFMMPRIGYGMLSKKTYHTLFLTSAAGYKCLCISNQCQKHTNIYSVRHF